MYNYSSVSWKKFILVKMLSLSSSGISYRTYWFEWNYLDVTMLPQANRSFLVKNIKLRKIGSTFVEPSIFGIKWNIQYITVSHFGFALSEMSDLSITSVTIYSINRVALKLSQPFPPMNYNFVKALLPARQCCICRHPIRQPILRKMPVEAILLSDIRPTSTLKTVSHNDSNHYADQPADNSLMQAKNIFHERVLHFPTLPILLSNLR